MGSIENRADAAWNRRERNETETQRLDRNWSNLLEELRVVQTGYRLIRFPLQLTDDFVLPRALGVDDPVRFAFDRTLIGCDRIAARLLHDPTSAQRATELRDTPSLDRAIPTAPPAGSRRPPGKTPGNVSGEANTRLPLPNE